MTGQKAGFGQVLHLLLGFTPFARPFMEGRSIMELSSQFLFVRFPNTCFRFLTDAYESFSMFIRPKRNGRTVLSIFELLLHELQFNFHSSLMRTREKMGSTSRSVLMGYVFG